MAIFLKATTDFRLSPWNKAGSAHNMYFTPDKFRYNLVPLIDYLSSAMYSIGRCFIYRTTFTLTNLTSRLSGLSYGTNLSPAPRVRKLHPLHFTFAFTSRSAYVPEEPKFRQSPRADLVLWGPTLYTSCDFMTIGIPKRILTEMGMTTLSLREMTWLYMFVGAFTKGFVNRNEYYSANSVLFNKTTTFKGTLHYKSLPSLFKRYAYPDWIFSALAWQQIPNALHPSAADSDEFCSFYCKNLTKFYGKYKTQNVIDIEDKVVAYLRGEVLRVLAGGESETVNEMKRGKQLPDISEVESFIKALLEDV